MGILNDLKKIFFGASAVGKTVTSKTTEFVKEESEQLVDKAKDIADKSGDFVSEKTSGLKDSIMETSGDFIEKSKEKLQDIKEDLSENEMVKKAADISEDIGEKVISTGEKLAGKAAEISEDVGEKVIEKGGELLEKSKEVSESVGEKLFEVKDELVEKAKDVGEKISEKLNETMEKAEAFEEAEKAKPKKDFADEDLDTGGSLLDGTDDFFAKADKYAAGEYDAFSEGKMTIHSKPEDKPTPPSDDTPATGFTDSDGDGNEIIDDAIINEEEE